VGHDQVSFSWGEDSEKKPIWPALSGGRIKHRKYRKNVTPPGISV
jgi:hypothetical protein